MIILPILQVTLTLWCYISGEAAGEIRGKLANQNARSIVGIL